MHFQSISITCLAFLAGIHAQSTLSSLTFSTEGVTGSMTAFTTREPLPTSVISSSGSSIILSGTNSITRSTVSPSTSIVQSGTSSSTRTIVSGSTSTGTSSASQAAATSSHNAQVRIGSNDAMLGVVGAIAGLVAFA